MLSPCHSSTLLLSPPLFEIFRYNCELPHWLEFYSTDSPTMSLVLNKCNRSTQLSFHQNRWKPTCLSAGKICFSPCDLTCPLAVSLLHTHHHSCHITKHEFFKWGFVTHSKAHPALYRLHMLFSILPGFQGGSAWLQDKVCLCKFFTRSYGGRCGMILHGEMLPVTVKQVQKVFQTSPMQQTILCTKAFWVCNSQTQLIPSVHLYCWEKKVG